MPASSSVHFSKGVGQAVVGREHHDGVLVAAACAQRVEHQAEVGVGHLDAPLVAGKVRAGHLVVGDVHRGLGVVLGARLGVGPGAVRRMLPVGDKERARAVIGAEPPREPLGVLAVPLDEVLLGVGGGVGRDVLVVAEGLGRELVVGVVAHLVLHAAEHAAKARLGEQARQVARAVDPKAALREAEHAVLVRVGSREQPRAARRARGGHAERMLEQHRVLAELLHARGLHGIAVRGDDSARVVRVQIEDVHAGSFQRAGGRAVLRHAHARLGGINSVQ